MREAAGLELAALATWEEKQFLFWAGGGGGDTMPVSLLGLTQVNNQVICGDAGLLYLLFHILFASLSASTPFYFILCIYVSLFMWI